MSNRVKRIAAVFAAVVGAAVMPGAPASAQVYPGQVYSGQVYPGQVHSVADILPPHEVMAIVRDAGMQPVSRPVWRLGRYVLLARDRYGRTLRVSVDARMGEVIRAVPAESYADVAPRGYFQSYPRPYRYPRDAYPPAVRAVPPANVPYQGESEYDGYDDGDLPPPDSMPRVIPGPRSAAPSSSKSAALAPKPDVKAKKVPPLPRARPSDMASAAPNPPTMDKPAPAEMKGPETTSSITTGTKDTAGSAEPKKDIRVIDLSKPKPAEAPDARTAAAEPKVAPVETKSAETNAATASGAKPLEDPTAKPRF